MAINHMSKIVIMDEGMAYSENPLYDHSDANRKEIPPSPGSGT